MGRLAAPRGWIPREDAAGPALALHARSDGRDVEFRPGRLLALLRRAGPALVKGVDLSAKAIDEAGHRPRAAVRSGRVTLEVGDLGSAALSGFDWVIGLGLLDWLSDTEILQLFRRIFPAPFLFSISERRRNLAQLV